MLSPQSHNQSLLMFRVGPVLCCAPSQPVVSIIMPPAMTHPPGTSENQPGIFRYTHQVYKVVDLRFGFGVSKSRQKQPGRLILTRIGTKHIAFWIDDIIDVLESPASGWGNLPAHIPHGIFTRTVIINEKIHLFAEFDKLVQLRGTGYLREYLEILQKTNEKPRAQAMEPSSSEKAGSAGQATAPHAEVDNTETALAHRPAPSGLSAGPTEALTQELSPVKKSPAHTSPAEKAAGSNTAVAGRPSYAAARQIPPLSRHPGISSDTGTLSLPQPSTHSVSRQARATPPVEPTAKSAITTWAVTSQTPGSADLPPRDRLVTTPTERRYAVSTGFPATGQAEVPLPVTADIDVQNSGFPWLTMSILLLLLGLAGISGWLLLGSNTATRNPGPAVATPLPTNTARTREDAPTWRDEYNQPALSENTAGPASQDTEEPVAIPATARVQYQAEIQENDHEVTLILRESISTVAPTQAPPVNRPQQSDQPAAAPPKTLSSEARITPVPETAASAEPQRRITRRITHIVVPGDTLWAIARHYVDDPYRYPELARLSKIKNPDRIYPGNRIHIHFEQVITQQ